MMRFKAIGLHEARYCLRILATNAVVVFLAANAGAQAPPEAAATAQAAGQQAAGQQAAGQQAAGQQAAGQQAAEQVGANLAQCVPVSEIDDREEHIRRYREDLSSKEICISQDVFTEGGLRWQLRIIQNRAKPHAVFWLVPHDNEIDAFHSAVYGVKKYGGTVVAVETGGSRYNGPQDPNRNFDAGTGLKCREQVAASPVYTEHVMKWWTRGAPILALHTNYPTGEISISKPLPGAFPFRSAASIGKVPDHTMIFVASSERPENNPTLMQFVKQLNQKGINVQYEVVSRTHNDCSMSNYASLKGIRDYVNIEVVQTDGSTQQRIIDDIMPMLLSGAEAGKPTAPEVASGKPTAPEVASGRPTVPEVAAGKPPVVPSGKSVPAPKVEAAGEDEDEVAPPAKKPEERPAARACVVNARQAQVAAGTIKLPPISDAGSPGAQILVRLATFQGEGYEFIWPSKVTDSEGILSQYKPLYRTIKADEKKTGLFVGPFETEADANTVCGCLRNVNSKFVSCAVTRN